LADDEKTFGRYLGYVAAMVGILAVVVPATLWVANHLHGGGRVQAAPTATGSLSAASSSTSTDQPADAARQVLLSSLFPEKGGQYFGALPHALAGQPAYANAVPMPCPTNDIGDKSHTVTYSLNGRYLSLHAELRPYRSASDESQVQYKFSADNGEPQVVVLDVNTSQSIDIKLEGIRKLSVEITCQPPGSLAVLTNAYLEHT
jgi:hypothetical protein